MNRADLRAALEKQNVRPFLKAIRLGEGTSDEDGYYRIVGSANGRQFSDDSRHPRKAIWIPKYAVWSTAAGAYQIIFRTWAGLCEQYDFPDFKPATQDEAAVALIAGRLALSDVLAGWFADAVHKCSEEWASLPGSTAGQRTEAFAGVQQVYLDNGGVLA